MSPSCERIGNGAKERLWAVDPVRFRDLNVKLAARAAELAAV
jgi:hypothetical protein